MNDLKETKDKLEKLNIDNTVDNISNKNNLIDDLKKEIQLLNNNQEENKKLENFIIRFTEQ